MKTLTVDMTVTLSIIVAMCSIVAPVISSVLTNRYNLKLRRLDYAQKQMERQRYYDQTLYEEYLKSAGRCIGKSDFESMQKYKEAYYLLLAYAPSDIRAAMIEIDSKMHTGSTSGNASCGILLNDLSEHIHELLQRQSPQPECKVHRCHTRHCQDRSCALSSRSQNQITKEAPSE